MHHTASRPEIPEGRRPKLEVADVFRTYGESYRHTHPLTADQRRAMGDIEVCRTAALGGHLDVCNSCDYSRPSYNSCRNRHCPKCQGLEQARWIDARKARVLPVQHFHVVFTLPAELRPLAIANRSVLFDILFESAARTLLEFSRDEKWIGGQPGLTAVLHTWTRDLQFHPHVHCVLTDGGLDPGGDCWRPAKGKGSFIFPVRALSEVFRAKFVAALVHARESGKLLFAGGCADLAGDEAFAALNDELFRGPWVVYAKRSFRGADHVFEYLGRYTHRVGISNHRLLGMSGDHVVFRTRGNKKVRLHAHEFIRRFLLHILPRGFVKIRHYGLYASANVETRLARARQLITGAPANGSCGAPGAPDDPGDNIDAPPDWREQLADLTGIDVRRCPQCHIGILIPVPLDDLEAREDPAPPPG